jgi:uncharacterized protein involved in exopolysaccharide biosynthesis
LAFRELLNAKGKEVIGMRKLFYTVARRSVMLRALFVLTVLAAIAIAGAAPNGFHP